MPDHGALGRIASGTVASGIALLVLLCLLPRVANAADADREQCTCNLKISGLNKAGSKTMNAAACVRHQFQNWCEIYVAALENTRQHQQLVVSVLTASAAGDPQSRTRLFLDLFDDYVKSALPREGGSSITTQLRSDRQKLETLMNDPNNAALISKCIDAFRSKTAVKYDRSYFSCSVGEVSKWLAMSFEIDDGTFTYLMAPAG